jgi:hypothetical protein
MALVSDVAIQSGLDKAHLTDAPPSTLMTAMAMLDHDVGSYGEDGGRSPTITAPENVFRA